VIYQQSIANTGTTTESAILHDPTRQKQFLMTTGAEPAAADPERELSRLVDKRAAGAELVMTQPVFDPATLMAFLQKVKPLGLRVVVGILPLASSRNAEFLHANVPGMHIPADVRARMAAAGEGKAAADVGVAIAAEALRAIRQAAGDQIAGDLQALLHPAGKGARAVVDAVGGDLDPAQPVNRLVADVAIMARAHGHQPLTHIATCGHSPPQPIARILVDIGPFGAAQTAAVCF
jgi:hypothetical protein